MSSKILVILSAAAATSFLSGVLLACWTAYKVRQQIQQIIDEAETPQEVFQKVISLLLRQSRVP
jgi:hypothetical protein